jgi:hypothetical protein
MTVALLDRLVHRSHRMTTKAISKTVNQNRSQLKLPCCQTRLQHDSWFYPLTRSMGNRSPLLPVA